MRAFFAGREVQQPALLGRHPAVVDCGADDPVGRSKRAMGVARFRELLHRMSTLHPSGGRQLVPLDTLKTVVDMAVEIGREGREGKPVGTLFVVGDSRKVMASSHPTGFDPVRGYSRQERDLDDPRVREGIKEIAQLDGAIVVSAEGIVLERPATSTLRPTTSRCPKGWAPAIGPPPPSPARPRPWPWR